MNKIIYTPTVLYKDIRLNRFNKSFQDLTKITNYLLDNISEDGTYIKYKNSEYDEWIKNSFIDLDLYVISSIEMSYKDFKDNKFDEIYYNLLLNPNPNDQLRYAIQYCNHDNYNIKMVANDVMRNKDIIELKNPKMFKLILEGRIDELEELTQ